MRENDPVGTYEALLNRIAGLGIAYLHVLIDPSLADLRRDPRAVERHRGAQHRP